MEKTTADRTRARGLNGGAPARSGDRRGLGPESLCGDAGGSRGASGAGVCEFHRGSLSNWPSGYRPASIEVVAMESTGVDRIPLYELLESRGFTVHVVNARHVKNVSGRKSHALDCQWLQQLMSNGLPSGAFRPAEQIWRAAGVVAPALVAERATVRAQAGGEPVPRESGALESATRARAGADGSRRSRAREACPRWKRAPPAAGRAVSAFDLRESAVSRWRR